MATAFISCDKSYYFAGDTVQGHIYLNLFSDIIANEVLVKFKGWESVRWFEERIVPEQQRPMIQSHLIFQNMFHFRMDSSDSQDHPGQDEFTKYRYVMENGFLKQIIRHNGEKKIARFDQVLHNFGNNLIPAGQYSFPFSFKTGQNYPASYIDKSVKNNRRGRIKYEMQAFVRGFGSFLTMVRCKQQIVIRESAPIKNDQQQMEAHVVSCCCIDQGTVRIQCHFEKNSYVPGQQAKIYCKIDNTQGKTEVLSVDVHLMNEITYTSNQGMKKRFNQQLFKKMFSGLGIGQQGQRQQVVQILNTQMGTSATDIKPTARGSALHSVYFLVVNANLAAPCTCCSNLPIVRSQILIYPLIPIDYNFKAPPNWHPVVMPMVNFQMGLSNILNVKMPSVNVNLATPVLTMNVPPPPVINYTMKVPPPPTVNVALGPPRVNMNVEMGNVKMTSNVGGMSMTTNMNTGMGMQSNTTITGGLGGGVSMNVNSNHGMSPVHHHHGNVNMNVSSGGMGVGGSVNVGGNVGVGMGIGARGGLGMNMKMGF